MHSIQNYCRLHTSQSNHHEKPQIEQTTAAHLCSDNFLPNKTLISNCANPLLLEKGRQKGWASGVIFSSTVETRKEGSKIRANYWVLSEVLCSPTMPYFSEIQDRDHIMWITWSRLATTQQKWMIMFILYNLSLSKWLGATRGQHHVALRKCWIITRRGDGQRHGGTIALNYFSFFFFFLLLKILPSSSLATCMSLSLK